MPQRAVARKLSQEIIERDLRPVLRAEARKAIAAAADTVPTTDADDDVRIESEPIARHWARLAQLEQKGNTNQEQWALRGGSEAPGETIWACDGGDTRLGTTTYIPWKWFRCRG